MRRVVEALASGALIYVVMAACSVEQGTKAKVSGSGGVLLEAGNDVGDSPIGTGGNGGTSGNVANDADADGSLVDAIADALTDPVPEAAASVSGSRIKARWLVADDGAREFRGWYDTQRGEDCAFRRAADGETRCLPNGALVTTKQFWADANCSAQPLFFSVDAACAENYALVLESFACSDFTHRVYPIGAAHTGTIYEGQPGACSVCANCGALALSAAGAEVAASSFVKGAMQTDS